MDRLQSKSFSFNIMCKVLVCENCNLQTFNFFNFEHKDMCYYRLFCSGTNSFQVWWAERPRCRAYKDQSSQNVVPLEQNQALHRQNVPYYYVCLHAKEMI